jgi:hypothetical protein
MSLMKGSTNKIVGKNIKTEMQHGKPQKQAVAIALNVAGKKKKKKAGIANKTMAALKERMKNG